MLSAILGLIQAVDLYLRLRIKSYYFDQRDKYQSQQKSYENQIEKLRATGTSASADAADLLREQLLENRRDFEYISAIDARASQGAVNKN